MSHINRKAVLLAREGEDRVRPGEVWRVRIEDHGTYFIAFPEEKVREAATTGMTSLGTLFPSLLDGAKPSAPKPGPAPATSSSPKPAAASTTVPVTALPPPKPNTTVPPPGATLQPHDVRPKLGAARSPLVLDGMLVEPRNVIAKGERVAIFVDGANIDNALGREGFFLDWRKVIAYFVADGLFVGAHYFGVEYMQEDSQRKFHDLLAYSGFIVRSKRAKLIKDRETGEDVIKGNVDIDLTLEMVAASDKYDVAVLFSGDSDFDSVVRVLQNRGKRVFIANTRAHLSQELFHASDKPVFYLEDMRSFLERDAREPKDAAPAA